VPITVVSKDTRSTTVPHGGESGCSLCETRTQLGKSFELALALSLFSAQPLVFALLGTLAFPSLASLDPRLFLVHCHAAHKALLGEHTRLSLLPPGSSLGAFGPSLLLLGPLLVISPAVAVAAAVLTVATAVAAALLFVVVVLGRSIVEHVVHTERAPTQRGAVEVVHGQSTAAWIPIGDEGKTTTGTGVTSTDHPCLSHRTELCTHRHQIALCEAGVQSAHVHVR